MREVGFAHFPVYWDSRWLVGWLFGLLWDKSYLEQKIHRTKNH